MQYQINGNQILVGIPSDNNYGVTPSNVNVPGILSTDKLPDAIDKLIGIIDKLAPAKSPNLSTKFLSLVGTFNTARHVGSTNSVSGNIVWISTSTQSAVTASSYANVFFGTNPTARVADLSSVNSGFATFSDGQSGYLQADIDYSMVVQQTLNSTYYTQASGSVSPDVGTYGNCLNITFDGDPYNVAPNQGFWTSLKAQMTGTQSFVSGNQYDGQEHIYQMSHLTTGSTPIFRFICDNGNASPPTSLNGNPYFTVLTQSSTKWVSGIPSLAVGDWIAASYSVNNTLSLGSYPLISRFYNSTRITRFNMAASASVSKDDLNSNGIPIVGGTSAVPYAYQPVWNVNGSTVSVTSGMFTDIGEGYPNGSIFSFNTYNPANTSNTVTTIYTIGGYGAAAGKKVFIDTVSNESLRVRSGQGQYPTFGTGVTDYSDSYSNYSTMSIYGAIQDVANEMMLYGGRFQYPQYDFFNNWPISGSNYATLDTTYNYSSYRWATFNTGAITNATSFTINILSSTGITSTGTNPITSNMLMYVTIVNGGTSVVGWLDGNSAYSSGNPSTNGDAAVDFANSTATARKITLGSIARTGIVYVRIGFSGTGKSFTNITKT